MHPNRFHWIREQKLKPNAPCKCFRRSKLIQIDPNGSPQREAKVNTRIAWIHTRFEFKNRNGAKPPRRPAAIRWRIASTRRPQWTSDTCHWQAPVGAGGRPTRATRGRREPEASPVFVVLCFWSIFGPFLTVLQCQANPW